MNFRDCWTVAKKDLIASLKDKVILIQIIILPFAIVFGYGMLMSSMSNVSKSTDPADVRAYYVNAPQSIEAQLKKLGYEKTDTGKTDEIKSRIKDKKDNLLIVFPENFTPKTGVGAALDNVDIWYNSEKQTSLSQFNQVSTILNALQPKAFTINAAKETYDLGDENAVLRNLLGTIFPIMVLMSVFMICMNLAAQSITGEKERGFMNTMLITPVKRSSIAIGKALSIFTTAIIGGLSAFTGMAVSLPQLAKAVGADETFTFGIGDYFLLFAATLTAVFVLVGILLVISTLAKDIKQATTIAPVFMMLLMVAGMLTMSDGIRDAVEGFGVVNYVIPAWNTMRIMQEIIATRYDAVNVAITCGVNLAATVCLIAIVSRLFNRESIITD